MSDTPRPDLRGVAETSLITLYNRAMESLRPDSLLKDEQAVALVKRLNYDFARIRQMNMREDEKVTLIIRSREFDRCTREFLALYPEAVVVHIGCGLDSRFERVDNGRVEWYDVDLPDVVALRRELIGGEGGRYHLLDCSACDKAWLDAPGAQYPRPFLFLAEGVLMYLPEAQVRSLVLALRDRFPGAELVFDAFSPLHIWASNFNLAATRLDARFRWGIWFGYEIENWGDGIQLIADRGYLDRPEPRLAYLRWLRCLPLADRAGRIYRFRLGTAGR